MTEFTEWIGGYPVHPVASLFPMIKGDELQALADDIQANGQYEPILLASYDISDPDGLFIMDGRNRFAACELAGVDPIFREIYTLENSGAEEGAVEITPASVGEWIISHNLKRRHLTPSQAAAVATEYEEYLAVEAKKRQLSTLKQNQDDTVPENLPERIKDRSKESSEQAGQMLGVSGRSVRDAKAVKKADPELFEQVKSGDVAVSAAAKKVREAAKPAPTQEELAERQRKQVAREVQHILKKGDLFAAQVRDGLIEALNQKEETNAQ